MFMVEIAVRIGAHGIQFCIGRRDWKWNLFDFLIMLVSVIDACSSVLSYFMIDAGVQRSGSGGIRVLRILRITRILRVTRVLRLVSLLLAIDDLRNLVSSVIATVKQLFWALVLLAMVLYTFGIVFTQAATLHRLEQAEAQDVDEIWGSLPRSMLTLYKTITSGMDWGDALEYMEDWGVLWILLFIFYITFCSLLVMNLVTAMFCQNAIELGSFDPEKMIKKGLESRAELTNEIQHLFGFLDDDDSGGVSLEELRLAWDDEAVQAFLETLGLQFMEPDLLFGLMGLNDSGELEQDQFLEACFRLQAPSTGLHIAKIEQRLKAIEALASSTRQGRGVRRVKIVPADRSSF